MNNLALRALKGAPLSICIAFFFYKDYPDLVFSESFFCQVTGYSPNTIRKSLDFLEVNQIIVRLSRYGGFILTDMGASIFELRTTTTTIEDNILFTEAVAARASISDVVNIHRTSISDVPTVDKTPKTVYNSSRHSKTSNILKKPLRDLLFNYGVGEPTCTQLTTLPWVDEEYILAHFSKGLKSKDDLGLIIHRIKNHDPMPRSKSSSCHTPDFYKSSWHKSAA